MKKKNTSDELKAQVDKLDAMRDEDIDTSDIPELGEDFWKDVRLRRPGEKRSR